ncbi:hypothetical protein RIF29_28573 [Crotalaria pallida]|uniref:Endonuclease/exonuclease/phosphatase domain-containing protein n=1 Tax=Crotalaria pallida TaxID=3830 RepID=A0AAN9EDW7_CROPI
METMTVGIKDDVHGAGVHVTEKKGDGVCLNDMVTSFNNCQLSTVEPRKQNPVDPEEVSSKRPPITEICSPSKRSREHEKEANVQELSLPTPFKFGRQTSFNMGSYSTKGPKKWKCVHRSHEVKPRDTQIQSYKRGLSLSQGDDVAVISDGVANTKRMTMTEVPKDINSELHLSCIYGFPDGPSKYKTTQLLESLMKPNDEAWMIIGDFNLHFSREDKRGDNGVLTWQSQGTTLIIILLSLKLAPGLRKHDAESKKCTGLSKCGFRKVSVRTWFIMLGSREQEVEGERRSGVCGRGKEQRKAWKPFEEGEACIIIINRLAASLPFPSHSLISHCPIHSSFIQLSPFSVIIPFRLA